MSEYELKRVFKMIPIDKRLALALDDTGIPKYTDEV